MSTASENMAEAAIRTPAVDDAVAAPEAAAVGNPLLIGVPTFLVGSIALGLVLVGYVSAAGASIPIIMTATGIGLVIAAVWAARLDQSAVAGVFGIFAGFWISYAALVLGLTHNWFGIVTPADALGAQKLFLLSWLLLIGLLTLASGRLPLAFTALFAVIELALLLVFLGTSQGSTGLLHAGGWAVFAFVLIGAYLFVDAMNAATGGRPLPLGQPILR
jgi:succinate-acetate transporter protein